MASRLTSYRWLPFLIMAGSFTLPAVSQAYCIYNNTSNVIRASVADPPSTGFARNISPGGSACCEVSDPSCNPGVQSANDLLIEVRSAEILSAVVGLFQPQRATGFTCAVPIKASGNVVVSEWSRRHLSVGQNAYYCEGSDESNQMTFRTPPGIFDTNRDVRFLVTADPQFNIGNNTDQAAMRAEANKVMRLLRDRVGAHHYEAPGYASDRIRGVLVAGDLTQDSRKDNWERYLNSTGGFSRFFYDGLGNHDIEQPNWQQSFGCSFGADYCKLPQTIYADVLRRLRGSVLTARGHTWDPALTEAMGTSSNLSPHYSWDWHDVHFVQLNVSPADFVVASAANDPIGAAPQPKTPYQALTFLKRNLELLVGTSGRPVVLIQHYGFDAFSTGQTGGLWFSWAQRFALWEAIKDYNVIAIFTGHVHLGSSNDPFRPFINPTNPAQSIPAFVAGAARGDNNRTPSSGTYLDVQIYNNSLIVRKMRSDGTENTFASRLIHRSPAIIDARAPGNPSIPQGSPYTMPTFVNPNSGAVGLQQFEVNNLGGTDLGGTPLRVESITIDPPFPNDSDAPPPWLSVTTQNFLRDPFSVPVGGSQIVDVLVEYRLAPEGSSTRTLQIRSNDPVSGTVDYEVIVNVDNTVSCSAPLPPIVLAPADGSTTFDTTPVFSWQAMASADEYRIQAVASDTNTLVFGPVLTATTSFEPSQTLASGAYNWTVEGHNTTGGCDIFGLPASSTVTVGQPQLFVDRFGIGTVTSDVVGIDCGNSCVASYPVGTTIQLQAEAFAGSTTVGATKFAGWSGDDDCIDGAVTLDGTTICIATFDSTEAVLTIEKSGSGSGTVRSEPAGIDCGPDCSEAYAFGTNPMVQLTPIADEGSIFAFWLGCDDGSTTVDFDQACTAVFRNADEQSELTVDVVGGGIYTVSPGSGTVTSDVPGIDCGLDCVERYSVGTAVELNPVPGPGSVFRDWDGGDATCTTGIVSNGSDTLCRANFGPTLLLVDDDDNGPNVLSSYTDALDTLGIPYDVWDTERGDKEPDAPTLGGYTRVIWFSGFADTYAGPGPLAESHLSAWLNTGQCLLISSQDYHSTRGLTEFMSGFLQVASGADSVAQSEVAATGPVFGGLGSFNLSYSFDNNSDSVSGTALAKLAFSGNQGDAGVTFDSGFYRTAFLSFPLEALPTAVDRANVLLQFLDFCASPKLTNEIFVDGFE